MRRLSFDRIGQFTTTQPSQADKMATTASDRRSSMSSIRSAVSRTSISSAHRPSSPQMGAVQPASPRPASPRSASPRSASSRPASPLSSNTAPLPPSQQPPVPPKDRLPLPMTPSRKPIQRQKSPLSSEAFSSPASMPGAFPEESPSSSQQQVPQSQQSNTQATFSSNSTPDTINISHSKRGKRLSSLRGILPLKSLRRSSDSTANSPSSPQSRASSGFRPTTPGVDSIAPSAERPSLRKKMSGSFWKRKSSLGQTSFMAGEDGQVQHETNGTNGVEDDTIHEDSRPTTPALVEDSPPRSRKSGTFWRRKSSLTLEQRMEAEAEQQGRTGENKSTAEGGRPGSRAVSGPAAFGSSIDANGSRRGNGLVGMQSTNTKPQEEQRAEPLSPVETDRMSPTSTISPVRTYSPPPQLPEFVGGGGGLGLDDAFFAKIE